MKRDFTIKGIDFTIGDYRPRKNEFEKGLKYQLLIKYYDSPNPLYFGYRSTGHHFTTMKEAREFAKNNICIWL